MNDPAGTPFLTRSEEETVAAGRSLAATLRAGDLVLLSGSLGAGKTAFVRGIAAGLGLDPAAVHSPTFAIVTEYPARGGGEFALVHVDLYRIESAAECEDLGLAEGLIGDRVMAVEWGERLGPRWMQGAIRVTIEDAGGDDRRITIRRS